MTENEAKMDARHRAVEACTDWARANGWENPVVISYMVITEVVSPDGPRGVTWVAGNGNDPNDEDRAGLKRYQIRGLLSEVEATLAGADS